MFDLAWSELLLVAVLAIVFVGPKDLPKLMRSAGQFAAKMRGMAREFQSAFDDIARESELDELRKQVAELRDGAMKPLTDVEQSIRQAAITSPDPVTFAPTEQSLPAENGKPDLVGRP